VGVCVQDNREKVVNGGQGLGYYQTTGDLLDPLDSDGVANTGIDLMEYLRSFNYGRVSQNGNGTAFREFTIVADDRQTTEISPGIRYSVRTFNDTVPGPTLRDTEGDLIRIYFINYGTKPRRIHTHGIHKAEMDGIFETINPGGRFVYEFYAEKFGVYPYHCHVMPLEEHICHGLYGIYIIDPKTPRPAADCDGRGCLIPCADVYF
jgi:FtsP/CotA-like multicopper oxidase with cupredoxin domain